MAASKTWLITGASSGLGASLAIAALKSGHRVIGTTRNPTKAAQSYPDVERLGGKWRSLDVNVPEATKTVQDIVEEAGRVDVVVNNAGYSILGGIEDMSEKEMQDQMNTNFYGPIRVLKGVLPALRAQRSGTVVNISSSAGIDGGAGGALYASSKFAIEGLSECLHQELSAFNIRVLVVEPGLFRTQFINSIVTPAAGLTKDYEGTPLEGNLTLFRTAQGKEPGDPEKAALRIVAVVDGTGEAVGKTNWLRLPLGPDCVKRGLNKADSFRANFEAMKDIASGTNF